MSIAVAVAARPMIEDDRRFVVDAWISSYRTAYSAGLISMDTWHHVMWPQVESILARPTVKTLIACNKDDPSFLYGFLCADVSQGRPIVYYAYTKETYRKGSDLLGVGVQRLLWREMGIDPRQAFFYVCKTSIATRLDEKIPLGRWNPLVGRFINPRDEDLHERPSAR